MGKTLVIKGADFYANRVDNITPPTPATDKNLVDPSKIIGSRYLKADGSLNVPASGASDYSVSDYIPVLGNDITALAISVNSLWVCAVVYDDNKNVLRAINSVESGTGLLHYTYQNGDAYIRLQFGLWIYNNWKLDGTHTPRELGYENFFACYGNELKPYVPFE